MSRWGLTLCVLFPACGGTTTSGPGREPRAHRSNATSCPAPPARPVPGPVPEPGPYQSCVSDAECTGGINGRCVQQRGGMSCVYDDCFADEQCTGGAVCECRGVTLGHACLPSGCRVDADCPGSWCSPTAGTCGTYWGTIGYQCHTPQDECTDDADCALPNMTVGYCIHSPEVGHWRCSYLQCVG